MKRMKKKVVAMVTLAMFVMTLLPMAAFAAADANIEETVVTTPYGTEFAIGEEAKVELENYKHTDNGNEAASLNVAAVFVTKNGGTDRLGKDMVKLYKYNGNNQQVELTGYDKGSYRNVEFAANDSFYATFAEEGAYTIHLKAKTPNGQWAEKTIDFTIGKRVADKITVAKQNGNLPFADDVYTLDLVNDSAFDAFKYNGVDTVILKGKVYGEDGKPVVNGDVTLKNTKAALELKPAKVQTDKAGNFEIVFSMTDKVNDSIVVTCGDATTTVKVLAAVAGTPDSIETAKDGGYVMAGTDKHYNDNAADYKVFSDAVQFKVYDQKGVELTGDVVDLTGYTKSIEILEKPVRSTLTATDLKVVWDGDQYTLKYDRANAEAVRDLVAGNYSVKIALDNGNSCVANFKAAEYGKTQSFDMNMKDATDDVTVTDKIVNGHKLKLTGKYVDANGLWIAADKVQYGVYDNVNAKREDANTFVIGGKDEQIGVVVKAQAFDLETNQWIEKEITIVADYKAYTLEFDSEAGKVNRDNEVNFKVVDKDGNFVKNVNGDVYYFVKKQGNPDAKVSVEAMDSAKVKNGEGKLSIYANADTTLEIVVAVKETANPKAPIYAGTLNYTVGAEDEYADTSVVLTIGSSEIVVNNELVKIDAAPYVDKNWRTMVPLRVITEAFGSEPVWNEKDRTVTVTVGSTEVKMTIDSTKYTVNGEEKTMDTAPVINNSRTMVPVRFVAEALGFTVTPLYNAADGTTGSVVIQK